MAIKILLTLVHTYEIRKKKNKIPGHYGQTCGCMINERILIW